MSLLELIGAVIGPANVLTRDEDTAPYLTDWRQRFTGRALAVVRPGLTEQIASVVRLCALAQTAIVPQGGNTGMVGGATPDDSGRAIVLSLARMNRIRTVDPLNNTIVVEAGCTLQAVQDAASAADRLFPLSLASEGSATIGGNLSTNAGGTQVLRYGNARDLALGLEVVLASGEVWDGLRGLRKDNTGYDLKDLFIGAEGTLGIITAACMKLYPQPRAQGTALLAVGSEEAALAVFERARTLCGPTLGGFEFFSDLCLTLVEKHFPDHRSPFATRHSQYVLIELDDHEDAAHAAALLEAVASEAIEAGDADDAVIAQSVAQSRALWSLRELISEAQAREGKNIKHDISVPISAITRFVAETDALLASRFAGVRMVTFGHLGDGNLHYNVSPPIGMDEASFLALQPELYACVHDQVARHHGSISAEHGIGQLKREELVRYKSAVELRLMRDLKRALDPQGLMNPGKVLAWVPS
jgi:FAD/FMN-containing dehydrogenase